MFTNWPNTSVSQIEITMNIIRLHEASQKNYSDMISCLFLLNKTKKILIYGKSIVLDNPRIRYFIKVLKVKESYYQGKVIHGQL
ncbi:hypothetical protein BpHYR1_022020 [Brachionus plicatilis]|uniref:Uncharacterized protein n=1 Tax=Brachionus plicatilis TaxID=10195 RepID=A0A3M7PM96_BRAPC|nr:hypothetical protein BpHYR1_022020 [Brachionus plicatilis]